MNGDPAGVATHELDLAAMDAHTERQAYLAG
jgi:hypothetical protein